jgi:predicted RNA-binding Zn-ribbon protein involved in translation (DUF1610 family)
MSFPFQLDPSSKKFICPNCGKKRFVKYRDVNNTYLSEEYGRCDRQVNCGFFNPPNFGNFQKSYLDVVCLPNKNEIPAQQISYIENKIVQASLTNYKINGLYQFLITHFTEGDVKKTFNKYKVGTSKQWGGSSIFWQIDYNQKIRSGKVIKYDMCTGKRIKHPRPLITWAHRILDLKAFVLEQVIFGEHLLFKTEGKAVICIVESEKTAIVCDILYPDIIWLATGASNQFKKDNLKRLRDREVIIFPDTDMHTEWSKKAKVFSQELNMKIYVSELILNLTIALDQKEGYDLADVFLRNY